MNRSQVQKLLSELEPYFDKLTQDVATAERRLAVAQNQADNLEERNRIAIETIEKEATIRKEALLKDHKALKTKLDTELDRVTEAGNLLSEEVENLNISKSQLQEDVENMEAEITIQNSKLQSAARELEETTAKQATLVNEISSLLGKKESLEAQIGDLNDSRNHIMQDQEILSSEAEATENRIIDLDAQFKSRKEYLDKQLADLQIKLKTALDSLLEAQKEDKITREAWAIEHQKLDKREQTVRRMEAKVSDAEGRIEELNRYDRL